MMRAALVALGAADCADPVPPPSNAVRRRIEEKHKEKIPHSTSPANFDAVNRRRLSRGSVMGGGSAAAPRYVLRIARARARLGAGARGLVERFDIEPYSDFSGK